MDLPCLDALRTHNCLTFYSHSNQHDCRFHCHLLHSPLFSIYKGMSSFHFHSLMFQGDDALHSAIRLLPIVFTLVFGCVGGGIALAKVGIYSPFYIIVSTLALIGTCLSMLSNRIPTQPICTVTASSSGSGVVFLFKPVSLLRKPRYHCNSLVRRRGSLPLHSCLDLPLLFQLQGPF